MFANHFGRFENVECGLVSLRGEGEGEDPEIQGIPLISVSVQATVVHAVTKVELSQVYVNSMSSSALEVIYYFPLDSKGGVTHFHAELDGRIIKGQIKTKEEAQAQYDRAIGQKQSDFLIGPNKPDVFKVRIGILKPGREVKIHLNYVTEVKHERGTNAIAFQLPTTLIPRYVHPDGTENPRATVEVTVNVAIQGKIAGIDSPSHRIDVQEGWGDQDRDRDRDRDRGGSGSNRRGGPRPGRGGMKTLQSLRQSPNENSNWTKLVAKFDGDSHEMGRDFELRIVPEEIYLPRIYAETAGVGMSTTALMAHLIPRFRTARLKVELIFVLDRSGSMKEFSIALAQRALGLFLHSLPVDCFFNIVGFGYMFQFLFPESRRYDEDSLRAGIAYVQGLNADMGGTEILEPLEAIYASDQIRGYSRQIFVLTDGAVKNTDEVIQLCRRYARTTRVFTLGIGPSASHELVDGMARVAGGTATYVTNNATFEQEVLDHLANAVEHSLTNIRLRWTGVPEESFSPPSSPTPTIDRVKSLIDYVKEPIMSSLSRLSPSPTSPKGGAGGTDRDREREIRAQNEKISMQIPQNIGPIFDGQQLVVFGLFPNQKPTGVEIEADSPDGPVSIHVEVEDDGDDQTEGMIHQLATIKAIRQLEQKEAELRAHPAPDVGGGSGKREREELRKHIVNLSCSNGVVSKHTAYVAIDTVSGAEAEDNWVVQTRDPDADSKFGVGRWVRGAETYSYINDQLEGEWGPGGTRWMSRSRSRSRSPSRKSPAGAIESGSPPAPTTSTTAAPPAAITAPPRTKKSQPSMRPPPPPQQQQQEQVFGRGQGQGQGHESPQPHSSTNMRPPRKLQRLELHLHALVATQRYNGSFPLNQAFAEAVGKPLGTIKAECRRYGWDEEGWATGLALIYLTERLSGLKGSWELVEVKGRKWLQNAFPAQITQILASAHDFFNEATSI